ncbi:amidase [Nevskia soli]|uniref:amidase n=1 Tax=Nevskia soli TaxID=418856 RepID=UPI0004A74352|nr:amidase [Nevskia soli]
MTTSNSGHSASRRDFLVKAGAGSAALLATSALPARAAAPSLAAGEDPLTLTVTRIAQALRQRQISAVELVQRCYARIDLVNPKINAVVATCRERALAEAQLADAAIAAGKPLGPLHGVPFTIKDSFDTAGVVSTGGTLGRKDYLPGKDATVVARVRAAGGILLGKTNTPEFTLGGAARETYNLLFGQTYNPYNTAYLCSGSSGGAGAIVAAYGAFFDIGSDYGGSIRGPAFANGIAGIKPTYGRSPRTGHIVGYGGPFDTFQETGPLARSVADLHLLLSIIGGPDGSDAAMAPVPLGDPAKVDLKKLRVAWYTDNGTVQSSQEVQALVKRCVGYFTDLGCKVSADRPPRFKELVDVRTRFGNADGGDHMRRMLKQHGTTQASPGLNLGDGVGVPSAEFTRLCEEMDAIKSEQLTWLEQYDLILCPVTVRAPQKVPVEFLLPASTGAGYGGMTSEYNTTGWPAGVVRAGTSVDEPGLPLGIHVVGQPWRDDVVLAAMAYIEGKTGGWRKPPI